MEPNHKGFFLFNSVFLPNNNQLKGNLMSSSYGVCFFKILGADYTQNLILILTAILAYFLYHLKERNSARAAARSVFLQVKEMEKNIAYLKSECINTDSSINEQNMYNSPYVYINNKWDIYSHILSRYLSVEEFDTISNFYEKATKINKCQHDVKNFILFGLQNRCNNYFNSIYCSLNKCEDTSESAAMIEKTRIKFDAAQVPPYIPLHYAQYLSKYLTTSPKISGTELSRKLEKLSVKKF